MLGQCATDFPVQILFFNRITLGFRYRVGILGHYATDFSEFFFLYRRSQHGGARWQSRWPQLPREKRERERERERDDDKWILFGKLQMVKP